MRALFEHTYASTLLSPDVLFDYTIIKPHHQCSHCGLVHVRDGQVCTKSLMLCQELSSDGCKVNQYLQRAALIGDALDTNPWSVANEPRGFIPLSDRHLEHACFIAHGVNRSVNLRPDMAVELDRLHKLYPAGNFDPPTTIRWILGRRRPGRRSVSRARTDL